VPRLSGHFYGLDFEPKKIQKKRKTLKSFALAESPDFLRDKNAKKLDCQRVKNFLKFALFLNFFWVAVCRVFVSVVVWFESYTQQLSNCAGVDLSRHGLAFVGNLAQKNSKKFGSFQRLGGVLA
jgi:hypothetical protein